VQPGFGKDSILFLHRSGTHFHTPQCLWNGKRHRLLDAIVLNGRLSTFGTQTIDNLIDEDFGC
jgi:hypothetical protein